MCRMCVNRSVPATAGARFVVSDMGDILSPKYAPEMIAPATTGSPMPRVRPMVISATPTVPMVDQLLPIASDTTEHARHATTRNTDG